MVVLQADRSQSAYLEKSPGPTVRVPADWSPKQFDGLIRDAKPNFVYRFLIFLRIGCVDVDLATRWSILRPFGKTVFWSRSWSNHWNVFWGNDKPNTRDPTMYLTRNPYGLDWLGNLLRQTSF